MPKQGHLNSYTLEGRAYRIRCQIPWPLIRIVAYLLINSLYYSKLRIIVPRSNTLQTAYSANFFKSNGFQQIQRLFNIPIGIFLIAFIPCLVSAQFVFFPSTSLALILVFSFLLLLIGFHIHYMMVRAGLIPFLIPRPVSFEFNQIVQDILLHEEFLKLKDYFHHTNHIYDHVVRVSYISYVMSKILRLDYKAAARGGLCMIFSCTTGGNAKRTMRTGCCMAESIPISPWPMPGCILK